MSISVYLSMCIYVYLSIYLHLYLYLSIYLSTSISISIYIHTHRGGPRRARALRGCTARIQRTAARSARCNVCRCLSISIYVYMSRCLYVYISVSMYLSVCVYAYLSPTRPRCSPRARHRTGRQVRNYMFVYVYICLYM